MVKTFYSLRGFETQKVLDTLHFQWKIENEALELILRFGSYPKICEVTSSGFCDFFGSKSCIEK